jgi:ADP-heptose:LPS heptosyltransferase
MSLNEFASIRRILTIRLDNIGDVIMLGPALRNLRVLFPGSQLTLMASPGGSQVAPLLPWVDDVFTWRAIWQDVSGEMPLDPGRELKLADTLRDRQYDAAFIFTSFSQSPHPPAYVCYLAGIPFRFGHSNEFGGGLLSHGYRPPAEAGHQADRNLALLESAGLPIAHRHLDLSIPEEIQKQSDSMLEESGIDPLAHYLVIAPGASCSSRRYDLTRFAQVLKILEKSIEMPVVVVGSVQEAETLAPLLPKTGERKSIGCNVISMVGRTTVPQLAGLIRRSRLVIANNSASLHMADAFEIPMVILYSGTEHESQWMPRQAPARLLRRQTSCSPCYKFRCPYDKECLDILPEEVVSAVRDLLSVTEEPGCENPVLTSNLKEGAALTGEIYP